MPTFLLAKHLFATSIMGFRHLGGVLYKSLTGKCNAVMQKKSFGGTMMFDYITFSFRHSKAFNSVIGRMYYE